MNDPPKRANPRKNDQKLSHELWTNQTAYYRAGAQQSTSNGVDRVSSARKSRSPRLIK
jgi:hypothetical protein